MNSFHRLLLLALAVAANSAAAATPAPVYNNPVGCVVEATGARAFVALAGPCAVAVVDLQRETMVARWPVPLTPSGLALAPDGRSLAVTMGETQGRVALLDPADGKIIREFDAGFSPVSPVFLEQGKLLAVCNRFTNSIGFYEAATGRLVGKAPATREPICAVASLDDRILFVGCLLPAQPSTAGHVASTIDVLDVSSRQRQKSILLPNGSTSVGGMTLSRDGNYLFVTHVLGHYQVPTNQLERGWMNANAVSIVDTAAATLLGTALLDDTTRGAANPWGVAVTGDGKYLAVAHAGTHEVSRIPLEPLLAIVTKGETAGERDLTVMNRAGRTRIELPGSGPRTLVATGSRVLVSEYFGGRLTALDFSGTDPRRIKPHPIALGSEPEMDLVRRGESRFADARLCFEGWQSCLSCHPGGRSDGLSWDLLNDGLGNPKKTKSLLLANQRAPVMALGVRANFKVAVEAGYKFILFHQPRAEEVEAVQAYIAALQPLPSPNLVKGELSESAKRGQAIYNQQATACTRCHKAPLWSDMKAYDVGTKRDFDRSGDFMTPTLIECWRTAPYMHDGSSATMMDVLTSDNKKDQHGKTTQLNKQELEDLVEFLLSL